MTIRKIATLGHPVLRQVARQLTADELASRSHQQLIDDMIETMHDANGTGLAAIQVYEPVQICVIEVQNNSRYPYKPNIPLQVLVNPMLTPLSSETFESFEGCLSVPGLRGRVLRSAEMRVQAWDRQAGSLDFTVRGISAGTYQHEVDHLHGILFLDRVVDPRSLCTWEHFERYEKARFVKEATAVVQRFGG